jgi:hypothetical protein
MSLEPDINDPATMIGVLAHAPERLAGSPAAVPPAAEMLYACAALAGMSPR